MSTLEVSALLFYFGNLWFFANGLRAWRTYLVDDAFITFRYADNIAQGHGIVWNIGGERVEGYSSPLHLAILVLVQFGRVIRYYSMKVLGVGVNLVVIPLMLIRFIAVLNWPRHSPVRFLALLLPGAWPLMQPTLIHAISGMDTSVVLFVYSAWIVLVDHLAATADTRSTHWRTYLLVGISAFLVSMVRSESGAIAILGLGSLLLFAKTRRLAVWSGVVFAGSLEST